MQVEQVRVYGQFADEILYAPFLGDPYVLPNTGNVSIDFGGFIQDGIGIPSDNVETAKRLDRLIEVTHTTTPIKVINLSVDDAKTDA